jgi:circadian clock protein KaiC
MRSIGLALDPWVKKGLLRFHAVRPTVYGLETHLASMHQSIAEFEPAVVVIDPLSNLISVGTPGEVKGMLVRLLDHLKAEQITGLFVSLTRAGRSLEETEEAISSLVDTWLLVRDIESDGERNRGLYVLKSRGMAHSNQIREFLLTDRGIELVDAYLGPEGVLTGTARVAQEARERATERDWRREAEDRRRAHDRRRAVLEAQLAAVRADLEAEQEALRRAAAEDEDRDQARAQARLDLARSRKADVPDRQAKKDGKQGPRK